MGNKALAILCAVMGSVVAGAGFVGMMILTFFLADQMYFARNLPYILMLICFGTINITIYMIPRTARAFHSLWFESGEAQ